MYILNSQKQLENVGTHIPINLYREIPSQLIKFNIEPHDLSDLTPNYIIEQYDKLMKDLVQYLPEKEENWKLFKVILNHSYQANV